MRKHITTYLLEKIKAILVIFKVNFRPVNAILNILLVQARQKNESVVKKLMGKRLCLEVKEECRF